MNNGCSPCACGVPGACQQLFFPAFLWPGIAVLALTLLVLVVLNRKKILKLKLKALLAGWLILALVFSVIVYFNTESAGDRTRQAVDHCQTTSGPSCEY